MAPGGAWLPSGGFPSAPVTDAIGLSPSSGAMMTLSIHLRRASLTLYLPAPPQACPGGTKHMHSIAPAPTLGLPGGVPIRHVAIIMPTSAPLLPCNQRANHTMSTKADIAPQCHLVRESGPSEGSERSEPPERARRSVMTIIVTCTSGTRMPHLEPHPLNPDNLRQWPLVNVCTILHATTMPIIQTQCPTWPFR